MSTQQANEKKFKKWELLSAGRLYWRRVEGNHGWYALYYKEVDSYENTLRFWQEIYDETGKIREMHEKYPIDKGHQKIAQ